MADANFWRDLAARFRSLPNDDGIFRIDWIQIVGKPGIRWKPLAAPETLASFEALARRAGFALDPNSDNFLFSWLSVLKEDSYGAQKPKEVMVLSLIEGDETPDEIHGSIADPCGASAVRCSVLERAALNSKRGRINLLPNDTQNLLSTEARDRLSRAFIASDTFLWQAQADIALKKLSDEEAAIELNTARLSKARLVLSAMRHEYSQLGLSDSEYRICMYREIEGACNSLELLDAQRRLLETELYFQSETSASPKTEQMEKPSDTPNAVGIQLNTLRLKCGLSIEALAAKVGLDPTNVSRHESGKSIPALRNISKYERIFSKLLNKQVVIDKTQLNAAKRR